MTVVRLWQKVRSTLGRIARPYRGAGVLFVGRTADGAARVLLCKRTGEWGRGRFSLIGGEMDAEDCGSYCHCAEREVTEETEQCGTSSAQALGLDGPLLLHIGRAARARWRLPGFCWTSYIIPVPIVPDAARWPGPCHEWTVAGWYPLDDLPRPLFWPAWWTLRVWNRRQVRRAARGPSHGRDRLGRPM